MAVHAHPDDESSKGAATMAKYVSEGVDVLVATCTGGERGSILNPKLQGDAYIEAHIHEVRRKEMEEAREILGVKQSWLGFVDSGLPEGDPLPPLPEGCFALQDVDEAAGELVRLIREFRPHVITTYDENGGYPHPDHIMTYKISAVAFDAAGDPERYPEAGEPWTPLKLYYNQGFNRPRTQALHDALLERGLESPYEEWLKRWDEFQRKERELTTYVPCADFFPVRDRALIAHATQIDPEGGWFRVPMEVQQEVWPTEEYELAQSRVETSLPESDLFAGIRDT
ncbi:mycothiol conjugate amidase Mca [Streptomyces sp. XM4193]|uniref:mycothiol conjugate amidase Mca n=1 Tax=Streptomyces sp. XM4193 TaxID=2929782 RepID=UPI001FF94243|nr:mycothiol conjugate amidase Mca [Streptomyces sp. XM4193]MCK1795681.1 mycothiol conjugate amidase Mca [Streptomyces sp. XM4193]